MSQALTQIETTQPLMRRVWAMPSHVTFSIPPIRALVRKHLRAATVSIDPFARNSRLATYTNDLNPDTAAEYHLEAAEFLRKLVEDGIKADLIIFDPPYSIEQCKRSYEHVGRPVTMRDAQIWGRWTEHKKLISVLAANGCVVLSFGWNSAGIGMKYGFEVIEVLLVTHTGAHNDTICTVERKIESKQVSMFQ